MGGGTLQGARAAGEICLSCCMRGNEFISPGCTGPGGTGWYLIKKTDTGHGHGLYRTRWIPAALAAICVTGRLLSMVAEGSG